MLLASAGVMGPPQSFKVVWPTVAEVKGSIEGWFAGVSVPGVAGAAHHGLSPCERCMRISRTAQSHEKLQRPVILLECS